MKSAAETRTHVDRVTWVSSEERDRIYDKHFRAPSSTVRFLCEQYQFDQKRVLDVACHYGYHLIHFGEGSEGVDATERYVQFSGEMGLTTQLVNIEKGFPTFDEPFDALFFSSTLEASCDANAFPASHQTRRLAECDRANRAAALV